MSLEQAVHERWAAAGSLAALLPAADVSTGLARGDSLPYASIERKDGRTKVRTNAGATLDEVTLRINVWHGEHDAGREIADLVNTTFDGAGFALAGGENVTQMRRTEERVSQHDDGIWRFALDFLVQICLSTGG